MPFNASMSGTFSSQGKLSGSPKLFPTGYHEYAFNNSNLDSGTNGAAISLTNTSYNSSIKKFGTHALDFNGNNAKGVLGLPLNTNVHTTAFWMYPRSHNSLGRTYMVDFRSSTYNQSPYGYWLFDSNGTSTFGGDTEYIFNWQPTFNTWQHMALVSTGSVLKFYWNGSLIAQANRICRTPNIAYLGTYFGATTGNYYLNGIIDNFYWNNSALTEQQIQSMYQYNLSF